MTPRGVVGRRRSPRFVIMVWAVVPGGTLSVLRDWVPRLAEHGSVSIVSHGPDRVSLGVPTVNVGGRWSHPFRFPNTLAYVVRMTVAAIRASARDGRRTVLVPQDSLATGAAAAIASLVTGARVAVMEHGSAAAVGTDRFWRERAGRGLVAALHRELMRSLLRVLNRFVLRTMDVALLAGADAVATFRSRGVADDRILSYRFEIDLERYHPAAPAERSEARRRWGLGDTDNVVLSVGRLAREKGLDDLVAAVAGLPSALRARLVLTGDGPVQAELQRSARTAGAAVTFVGELGPVDVASILHAADCFAYAALRGANTPFAVLEAMAAGLPVVATAAPRAHRAMLAGGRGIAVEPGDRDGLRAGIHRFLGDRAFAAAAGEAARRYVVANHGPASVDGAVDALVRRLWPTG